MSVEKEVMVDIETLGTNPRSQILTIGAVKFNRKGEIFQNDAFYIHIKSEYDSRFKVNRDTLEWWDSRSEAKEEAFYKGPRFSLHEALTKFSLWYGDSKFIWANSPSFDCIILEYAYKKENLDPPWKFYETRDLRTALDLTGYDFKKRKNIDHIAVNDAIEQTKLLVSYCFSNNKKNGL